MWFSSFVTDLLPHSAPSSLCRFLVLSAADPRACTLTHYSCILSPPVSMWHARVNDPPQIIVCYQKFSHLWWVCPPSCSDRNVPPMLGRWLAGVRLFYCRASVVLPRVQCMKCSKKLCCHSSLNPNQDHFVPASPPTFSFNVDHPKLLTPIFCSVEDFIFPTHTCTIHSQT